MQLGRFAYGYSDSAPVPVGTKACYEPTCIQIDEKSTFQVPRKMCAGAQIKQERKVMINSIKCPLYGLPNPIVMFKITTFNSPISDMVGKFHTSKGDESDQIE